MLTSLVDCMKTPSPDAPALEYYSDRFDCHRQQLQLNLGEFESHLSVVIPNEPQYKIYCWDRKRTL